MIYDPEEIFRDIVKASKGSDADLTGMLEVERRNGIGLYDQIRELRGVQWPAPTYEIAKAGGTAGRVPRPGGMGGKTVRRVRRPNSKAKMKLCEQDYGQIHEITAKLMQFGHRDRPGEGPFLIDELAAATKEGRKNLLEQAQRSMALPPELPDLQIYDDPKKTLEDHKREDVYPFWLGLGIVYEHFHSAKTIRGATTMKLIPEQYIEMNLNTSIRTAGWRSRASSHGEGRTNARSPWGCRANCDHPGAKCRKVIRSAPGICRSPTARIR